MAAAQDVTFDVLLGGKIQPQVIKMFNDLEAMMKKQGATAKTINAVMGRAYKETFDEIGKDAKKGFESVEKSSAAAFHKMIEHAREAQAKVNESFAKMREGYNKFAELVKKPLEYFGITGVVAGAAGTFFGARAGEELIKEGIKVHRARETQAATLRATLMGRGAGLEAPEWEERAEQMAREAHVGHEEAMKLMTRLAASGRYNAEQAQRMSMALIGLGGGTAEGAEASRAAFGKASMMITAGKVRPTAIAGIAGGAGLGGALLQQIARDTGIPITELSKQFGAAKVSKKTGEVTGGALAGAKGIQALNKAILELGESRGFELIKAKMSGMNGLFYRFGEIWEDFVDKIGKGFEEFISPLAERVSSMLESINFTELFKNIVERAKEFGHLLQAVWDTVANAPVLKTMQAMWENFWHAFTGGIDLYEKDYKKTWADAQHTHVVMARQMTEAGQRWVQATSERIEAIMQAIMTTFQWFIDHGKDVVWWVEAIAKAFIALKAIEVATTIINFTKAVAGLTTVISGPGGVLVAIAGMVTYFTKLIESGTKYMQTEQGKAQVKAQEAARLHPGESAADIARSMAAQGQGSTPAARAAYQTGLEYASRSNDKAAESALKTADAFEKLNKLNEDVRIQQQRHKIMIEQGAAAVKAFDDALKMSTGNDLKHFDMAVDTATQALLQLSQNMSGLGGFAGGTGGGAGGPTTSGYAGGDYFTQYGPAVAGDQPGQATYDWNSYHHVGAWPGKTGPLRAGDVALGLGAQAKYHVQPGDTFVAGDGKTYRFADRSGSKNPMNIDVFKGAMGGIFRRPTQALIGESGPEAVLPLQGAGAAVAGLGSTTINITVSGIGDSAEHIAAEVDRVLQRHYRRSAVV